MKNLGLHEGWIAEKVFKAISFGPTHAESVNAYCALELSKKLASRGGRLNLVKSMMKNPAKGNALIVVGNLRWTFGS